MDDLDGGIRLLVYGYAKEYMMNGDGTMSIRVRIPSIHGPYKQSQAGGRTIRNYVQDDNLPWYPSIMLPYTPTDGDVVALISTNDSGDYNWFVIGLTGGSYNSGLTDIGV